MTIRRRRNHPAVKAAAVSLGLVLSGCGGSGSAGGDGSGGGGFFNNMFGGTSPSAQTVAAETSQLAPVEGASTSLPNCPDVEIAGGMESIQVHAGEKTAGNLRYQATIRELARECSRSGSSGSVKLGVSGRVVLGPKGSAGQYVVPVRVTVLRGGTDQIYTKAVRVPVSVRGQGSEEFVYVAENVTFPLESASDRLTRYVINVGFDTGKANR